MKAKLSVKEAKFLKEYLSGRTLAECAKLAGCKCNSKESYSATGSMILKSLNLSNREILDAMGVTDQATTKTLLQGLKARKVIVATFQGQIGQMKSVPDPPTRAKFLEIYHRLRGNFLDRLELAGQDGGDIRLVINSGKGKKKKVSVDLDPEDTGRTESR